MGAFHYHGIERIEGPAIECGDCVPRETAAMVVRGELSHDQAWERAKEELGIGDVRQESRERFERALQLAERIRKESAA
jgi:hypothetical protein